MREDTTMTRALMVESCPVTASDVPNSLPMGFRRGLNAAILSKITAAPRQSTARPSHVRTVYPGRGVHLHLDA